MNKRLPITFICILMLVSLVCVGFSAWSIGDSMSDSSTDVTGSISVDDVISSENTYITTTATVFEYYDDSFLLIERDGEGSITSLIQSDTGYISISAAINKSLLPSYEKALIKITFEQTNKEVANLLTSDYVTDINIRGNSGTNFIITYSDYGLTAELGNISTISESYLFDIIFTVSNTDTTFFSTLLNNNVGFTYSITIEGDTNA